MAGDGERRKQRAVLRFCCHNAWSRKRVTGPGRHLPLTIPQTLSPQQNNVVKTKVYTQQLNRMERVVIVTRS